MPNSAWKPEFLSSHPFGSSPTSGFLNSSFFSFFAHFSFSLACYPLLSCPLISTHLNFCSLLFSPLIIRSLFLPPLLFFFEANIEVALMLCAKNIYAFDFKQARATSLAHTW